MRSSIFVLTLLVLAGFGDVRTVSAKTSGPDIAPISEFSSRGFAWFFSHVRPEGRCAGRQVVATWYASGRRTCVYQKPIPAHSGDEALQESGVNL